MLCNADDDVSPAPTLETLVAEWVLRSHTLTRKQKMTLLRRELEALDGGSGGGPSADLLSGALAAVGRAHDVAFLRRAVERVSATTDLDALYDLIDPGCTVSLSYAGETRHLGGVDVDEVVGELCEQQEAIQRCRGDHDTAARLSSTTKSATSSSSAASSKRRRGGGVVTIGSVSEVKSWCCPPREGGEPNPRMSTQMTYYADANRSAPIFSLHTEYTFTAEGRAIEHIARTLLPHSPYDETDLLQDIHFGPFRS